jgi:hypothetical protein
MVNISNTIWRAFNFRVGEALSTWLMKRPKELIAIFYSLWVRKTRKTVKKDDARGVLDNTVPGQSCPSHA